MVEVPVFIRRWVPVRILRNGRLAAKTSTPITVHGKIDVDKRYLNNLRLVKIFGYAKKRVRIT